jgi:hypothetical protein
MAVVCLVESIPVSTYSPEQNHFSNRN